ncbi:hypothetical protein TIFTF001_039117 [Ficus carica]|uniref:Uncharacterized protein n=1 Tax=Ficus carica TaxID=3494 RepID=A0AA88JEQ4_FICCA|nr:hypothetical protein TIFTF001_039117 [Ficus carica]
MVDIGDVDNTATTATMAETNAALTDLMSDAGASQCPRDHFTVGTGPP